MEAIVIRLEAIASRLEAIAIRLEAIASRLEAIAIRLEAIARRLEAIDIRLVIAVVIRFLCCMLGERWMPYALSEQFLMRSGVQF